MVKPPGEPEPAGVAQVASPRQKVLAEAEVPLFRLVTGRLPVTPVVSGRPVALVRVALVGVPRTGVTNVGLVDSTTLPVPVFVVTPVPPLSTANVPAKVIVPDVVTGLPETVSPVVPPERATLVTVPLPPPPPPAPPLTMIFMRSARSCETTSPTLIARPVDRSIIRLPSKSM